MDSKAEWSTVLGPYKPKIFLPALDDPIQPNNKEIYTPSAASVIDGMKQKYEQHEWLLNPANVYTLTYVMVNEPPGMDYYLFVYIWFGKMTYQLINIEAVLTGAAAPSSGDPSFGNYSNRKVSINYTTKSFIVSWQEYMNTYYSNYRHMKDNDVPSNLAECLIEWDKEFDKFVRWQEYVQIQEEDDQIQKTGIGFPHIPGLNPIQYGGWFFYAPQMMTVSRELTAQMWARFGITDFVILKFDSVHIDIESPLGVLDLLVWPLWNRDVYNKPNMISQEQLVQIRNALPGKYGMKNTIKHTPYDATDQQIASWMGLNNTSEIRNQQNALRALGFVASRIRFPQEFQADYTDYYNLYV